MATTRPEVSYEDFGSRFLRHNITNSQEKENTNNRAYGQFNSLYLARLQQMRPLMMAVAKKRWEQSSTDLYFTEKIIDCETLEGKECVLVGTLYKEMELKPSVLDEFKELGAINVNVKPIEKYSSPNDFLLLEDESGRVRLIGLENYMGTFVTGVMVALRGIINDKGVFDVRDWTTCGERFKDLEDTAQPMETGNEELKYVLLASDLDVCDNGSGNGLSLQMLVDFIHGNLGAGEDRDVAKGIVRIVIAGNCIASPEAHVGRESKASVQKYQMEISRNSKKFDLYLAQMLSSCPVDVMPGESDPVNFLLPQQPLHPCLIPHSARFSSLGLHSNPYEVKIENRSFMGHSGQPIKDISLQTNHELSKSEEHLQILGDTLQWSHLAPSAPDTTPCYPFTDSDPFVIKTLPHVLFSGNEDVFATKLISFGNGMDTRLICVPSFKKTQEVVLLELNSLTCRTLSFKANII